MRRCCAQIDSDPQRGAQGPLHLLIDSSGAKVEGEGEWNARKHGGPTSRVWRKVQFWIDVETSEVRAVKLTSGDMGDADHAARTIGPEATSGRSMVIDPTRPWQGSTCT